MTKLTELAVLTVNGEKYEDWESVLVKHALREQPPYHFRFTCSEGMPLAKNWAKMRVRPGDQCTVTLAGQLAISGTVDTRQVVYDARKHHIEIQGAALTLTASTSVVTKTGEFNNNTFEQIARSVLGKLKINFTVEGGALPQVKIPRASVTPGISVYDFLDDLGKHVQAASGFGISFTSNEKGDFVVIAGHEGQGGDAVIEGQNILEARSIIYNANAVTSAPGLGQRPGDNKTNMAKAAQPIVGNLFKGLAPGNALSAVIVAEGPAWTTDVLKSRAKAEQGWLADDQITVFATVYGWLRPSGGLWKRAQKVSVTSPMLIMSNEQLYAKSVTFTQDNTSGTRTVLELCNELALGGLDPGLGGSPDE